jgi:hypothetical protein
MECDVNRGVCLKPGANRQIERRIRDESPVADSDTDIDRKAKLFHCRYRGALGVLHLVSFNEEGVSLLPDDAFADAPFVAIDGIAWTAGVELRGAGGASPGDHS